MPACRSSRPRCRVVVVGIRHCPVLLHRCFVVLLMAAPLLSVPVIGRHGDPSSRSQIMRCWCDASAIFAKNWNHRRQHGRDGGGATATTSPPGVLSGTSSSTQSQHEQNSDPSRDRSEHNFISNHSSSHAHHHRPERGKVLSNLSPTEMCQAYQEIQHDYQTKAFAPTTKWKLLKEKDGVQVSLLHHPSDPTCPYVKMTGILPVSVQDCWNFLLVREWDRTMPKMDPFYEGVSIYGEYQHHKVHMTLCRKRTQRILAFGKRDLVFLSVIDEPLSDGTWVSGSVSVITHEIPRQPGYTRAFQDSIAFYQPLEHNTKTKLTIVCRIDLNDSGEDGSGGFIPMWLYVKTIGYTAVQSVIRMREAVVEEVRQRKLREEAKHKSTSSRWFQPTLNRGLFPTAQAREHQKDEKD